MTGPLQMGQPESKPASRAHFMWKSWWLQDNLAPKGALRLSYLVSVEKNSRQYRHWLVAISLFNSLFTLTSFSFSSFCFRAIFSYSSFSSLSFYSASLISSNSAALWSPPFCSSTGFSFLAAFLYWSLGGKTLLPAFLQSDLNSSLQGQLCLYLHFSPLLHSKSMVSYLQQPQTLIERQLVWDFLQESSFALQLPMMK